MRVVSAVKEIKQNYMLQRLWGKGAILDRADLMFEHIYAKNIIKIAKDNARSM